MGGWQWIVPAESLSTPPILPTRVGKASKTAAEERFRANTRIVKKLERWSGCLKTWFKIGLSRANFGRDRHDRTRFKRLETVARHSAPNRGQNAKSSRFFP